METLTFLEQCKFALLIILLAGCSIYLGYLLPTNDFMGDRGTSLQSNPQGSTNLWHFLQLGKEFADNHSYNLTGYNCVDYSNDFHKIVRAYNYSTYRVDGCDINNKSVCHRWLKVLVDYEPITAQFVDYSNTYEIWNVIDSE